MLKSLVIIAVALITVVTVKFFLGESEADKENRRLGSEFLANNKERPGVEVTQSGLHYEFIRKGPGGSMPKHKDRVKVHYHGTLIDGTVFDSSVGRGEPITFALHQVIKGWTEGLQLMAEGDKMRLFIPPELAYGSRSAGKIPANSTLIFEVELIKIEL